MSIDINQCQSMINRCSTDDQLMIKSYVPIDYHRSISIDIDWAIWRAKCEMCFKQFSDRFLFHWTVEKWYYGASNRSPNQRNVWGVDLRKALKMECRWKCSLYLQFVLYRKVNLFSWNSKTLGRLKTASFQKQKWGMFQKLNFLSQNPSVSTPSLCLKMLTGSVSKLR